MTQIRGLNPCFNTNEDRTAEHQNKRVGYPPRLTTCLLEPRPSSFPSVTHTNQLHSKPIYKNRTKTNRNQT
ncbi:hypothetical protein NEUTE1DRAFT_115972, partial [Neurospora tetrasperma FGSC 2508]